LIFGVLKENDLNQSDLLALELGNQNHQEGLRFEIF